METVFMLFEGRCPTCGAEVEIVEVSGLDQFLAEYQFIGEFEQHVWNAYGDGLDNDGMVGFCCANGHRHEVYHHPSGDWLA